MISEETLTRAAAALYNKLEKDPIRYGHLPTLDFYDNKQYNNKPQTVRRNFLAMSKRPRKIDFLDGQDHGPMSVEEGQRYTRQQKRAYLMTRVAKALEPVSFPLEQEQFQEAA